MTAPLPDGIHDVLVVDAVEEDGRKLLTVTLTTGEHKGTVLEVSSANLDLDEIELLGMPGTLTVTDGEPAIRIDG